MLTFSIDPAPFCKPFLFFVQISFHAKGTINLFNVIVTKSRYFNEERKNKQQSHFIRKLNLDRLNDNKTFFFLLAKQEFEWLISCCDLI